VERHHLSDPHLPLLPLSLPPTPPPGVVYTLASGGWGMARCSREARAWLLKATRSHQHTEEAPLHNCIGDWETMVDGARQHVVCTRRRRKVSGKMDERARVGAIGAMN
jgi:hypothetical protein